jgi:hypothetical protein
MNRIATEIAQVGECRGIGGAIDEVPTDVGIVVKRPGYDDGSWRRLNLV